MLPGTEFVAAFLAGFIVAEGCFTRTIRPARFRFSVSLGATDSGMCAELADFLGVGHIHWSQRRKAHYDDEVSFAIQSIRDHVAVTIPFMDAHLPDSYKRTQYLPWRSELLDYWAHRAKRRRPCTVEGCDELQRAHGFCRRHLWVFRRQ